MAPRATWKGFLKLDQLSCPVALFTAVSTAERIAFHTLNRKTGHRVHRQYIDAETGETVEADQQVKGYETAEGEYVVLEPEEIAAAIPGGGKTLDIEAFIPCGGIDALYRDRPYYLAPASPAASEAFILLRDGMRAKKVAALARAVLFRRVRSLLVYPEGDGMIAATLHFEDEVRSAEATFQDIAARKLDAEMLDLARHIIETKKAVFDPKNFDDRYEAALAELVEAKVSGRQIKPRKPAPAAKVTDLMQALRQSAKGSPPARKKAVSGQRRRAG